MTISDYNTLVDLHSDALFRFLWKSSSDRELAQDLVQESYLRLWNNLRKVEFTKAKSYLFTVAYNCLMDHFRDKKRKSKIEVEYNTVIEPMKSYDLKELLDHALNMLPKIQKSILLLRDYEGYSYKEIEEMTGLNESQVKVYIFRARTTMKDFLITNNAVYPSI